MRNLPSAGLLTFLVGCLGASGALGGCSSTATDDAVDARAVGDEHVGSLGLDLAIAGGLVLNQLSYAIVGPLGFSKTGTIDVSNSASVSALISGLPVGVGYSITLSGTTTDGGTSCAGSATFDVSARQTTPVSLGLTCHQAPSTGSVQLNGAINICPIADGISASPSAVAVGSTIALNAAAHDVDGGPAALTYHWSASSGTLSDPASATPTFSCTTAGTVTLSVAVSDGDPTADCADVATASVTCTATAAAVQAIIVTNCISCHSGPAPARGLSLVDVTTAIGAPAAGCSQKLRIVSGNAQQSYLVDKLMGAAQDGGCFSGKPMPLGKPALSAADLATITSWINAGTP